MVSFSLGATILLHGQEQMHTIIETIHRVYGTGHFYAMSIFSEVEKYLCIDIALGPTRA